ncbi:hypothetical protein H0W26_01310, partial [Candidatus Dependentiae bacterium]|nr:hypothetical protein [Candidatus Dependentiae bacterium]
MKIIRFICTFSIAWGAAPLIARTIRTPSAVERGPISELYTELNQDCWTGKLWGSYYHKSAYKAFNDRGNCTPFSTLFFNDPQFSPQQAFFQSTASSRANPLLTTSVMGPRIAYKESGFSLGGACQRWLGDTWRCGIRAQLPFKKIRMQRRKSCGNGASDLGGQTSSNLAAQRVDFVNGVPVCSFAYRLDFLSRLFYTCLPCPGQNIPLVNYSDTNFPPNNPITISNQDITSQNLSPVTVLASSTGQLPPPPFAITQEQALQLPILPGTGTLANGRAQFSQAISYSPLGMDAAQQARLFIVPSVAPNRVVAPARIIKQHVKELLECVDLEAENVFKECGISFESQCTRGIGDFDTELFIGHSFSDCFYAELYGGITFPTGKKVSDPRLIFRQPLGNNGHYEYTLGVQGLWQLHPWLAVQSQAAWHPVKRRLECVATAFQGASIKNIGLPTKASVAWDHVTFRLDVLITPPSHCA